MNFNSDWLRWIRAWLCLIWRSEVELQIIAHGTRIGINEKHYFLGIIIFIFKFTSVSKYTYWFAFLARMMIARATKGADRSDDSGPDRLTPIWFDLLCFHLQSKGKKMKMKRIQYRSMQWYQSENMKERTNSSFLFSCSNENKHAMISSQLNFS